MAVARMAVATLLDPFLPQTCLLCDERCRRPYCLCPACETELPHLQARCRRCALPLALDAELCGHCQRQPPAFDRCLAAFIYAPPMDRLISQFKHRGNLVCGRLLTELLVDHLAGELSADEAERPTLISPVPLHWRRQLRRGFNQAAYIAGGLARRLDLPLRTTARRVRATGSQQQLDRKARLRNLRDAFDLDARAVADQHVALVDDVVTTGATAEMLSRAYREAGARRVEVWAVARTPEPGHG